MFSFFHFSFRGQRVSSCYFFPMMTDLVLAGMELMSDDESNPTDLRKTEGAAAASSSLLEERTRPARMRDLDEPRMSVSSRFKKRTIVPLFADFVASLRVLAVVAVITYVLLASSMNGTKLSDLATRLQYLTSALSRTRELTGLILMPNRNASASSGAT